MADSSEFEIRTDVGITGPAPAEKKSLLRSLIGSPFLWIALAAIAAFFVGLGTPSLNDGEAMYAEIAREMRLCGDWITPHLNGARHFDKPPFLYWIIALSQVLMGETEFAARMWCSLAVVATVLVTGAIGRTLYGKRAGTLAALVYATSLGPFVFGRLVMPDMPLCLWIALAILGYLRGYRDDPHGRGPWVWVMFVSLGLCALTKGLLGIGLPVSIVGLHLLLAGRLRALFSWRLPAGACIVAGIAVPWHAAVARANPDFLNYFVIREHVMRFTGERYPADEFLPLFLFLALTFLWTFPWLALVPQAIANAVRRLLAGGRKRTKISGSFSASARTSSRTFRPSGSSVAPPPARTSWQSM
jgi:4-amino-4-deoxy-L-arabinose transferase-like glycosyltransferase